jgi:hypothetical protein
VQSKIDSVLEGARRILSNLDGSVHHEPPFRLVFVCDGDAFDLAVRRIARFALLLSVVLSGIVAVGAVPRLIGLIVLVWLGGIVVALAIAHKRRREHGRVLVDFEAERIDAEPRRGEPFTASLAGAKLRVVAATDAIAPLWLWLVLADGRALRLAKSDDPGLAPIVSIFRGYHVKVERDAER